MNRENRLSEKKDINLLIDTDSSLGSVLCIAVVSSVVNEKDRSNEPLLSNFDLP